MSKVQANKEYSTFVKGLVTERTPLTFPENASLDEDNFELLRDGSRRRRLGMDFEAGGTQISTTKAAAEISTDAISSHIWDNADRDGLQDIIVVQIGLDLWFFDANKDVPSNAPLNGGTAITITGEASEDITTASVFGKFIIVNGNKGFFVLSYDQDTDTVSVETRIVLVRDIWGVEEDEIVNERPFSLTLEHEYNLINQGWGANNPDSADNESYYTDTKRASGFYPSSADNVEAGKDPTDNQRFRFEYLYRAITGTTPAAKGFAILDLFRRGASRQVIMNGQSLVGSNTDLTGDPFALTKYVVNKSTYDNDDNVNSPDALLVDMTEGGLKTVESFAGRLWLAGASSATTAGDNNSPNLGGYVFFSQVVDNDSKLGKMYQEGDPTSEDDFEPVATDGGVIRIPDSGNIIKLLATGRSLLVFAQNGVWSISGGEQNFSATEFEINKITNVGVLSPKTIIEVEGAIMYWANAGIYLLSPDQVSGKLVPQNVTQTSIQTFYNNIRNINKVNATAIFDPVDRKIRWLYSDSDTSDGITFKNNYNRELIFDIILQCFYTNTIQELDSNSPFVAGYIEVPTFSTAVTTDNVTVGGDQVQVGGDDVVISSVARSSGLSINRIVKYLIIQPDTTYTFSFGDYINTNWADWYSVDAVGVDAYAFLLTGYETLQDTQRAKQAPYITCHFAPVEATEAVAQICSDATSELWESTTSAANSSWNGVIFGEEFVAVASESTNNVQTSIDGQTWTIGQGAASEDISSVTAKGTPQLVSVSGNIFGIRWGDNGNKLYTLTSTNPATIYEWNASTPYDQNTLSFSASLVLTGSSNRLQQGLFSFNESGTKFIVSYRDVYSYTLSTPWDITTAVNTGIKDEAFFLQGLRGHTGLYWDEDVGRLYLVDGGQTWVTIRQYLITDGDADTITNENVSFDMEPDVGINSTVWDMNFNPDKSAMYLGAMVSTNIAKLVKWDLPSPGLVSSATNYQEKSLGLSGSLNPNSMSFADDLRTFTFVTADDKIHQYEFPYMAGFNDIDWSGSLYVAVGSEGGMYSSDGDSWIACPGLSVNNVWQAVEYVEPIARWVAVASSGTDALIASSANGRSWVDQTDADIVGCNSVTASDTKIVFVGANGVLVSTDMTAANWDAGTAAISTETEAVDNNWTDVEYSEDKDLFVAVANSGTGDRVMTSDGAGTWTSADTSAASNEDNDWNAITYGANYFVTVSDSGTGNRIMRSSTGIDSWELIASPADVGWNEAAYESSICTFVAVGDSGIDNRTMVASSTPVNVFSTSSEGSCLLQAQWDFTDDINSGKWGTIQQVYRLKRYHLEDGILNYGWAVITTKSKIRGRGRALSLLFQTEPGKGCHIYGWGVDYTGVSRV